MKQAHMKQAPAWGMAFFTGFSAVIVIGVAIYEIAKW